MRISVKPWGGSKFDVDTAELRAFASATYMSTLSLVYPSLSPW